MIAVLAADHHIADRARFRRVLVAAGELAMQDYIVTLGIYPSFPATGYGYIRRGEPLAQIDSFQTYRAAGFTEKPDLPTAVRFLDEGLYSWNSGMFIYKAAHILAEYARQQPEMYALLQDIEAAIGRDDLPASAGSRVAGDAQAVHRLCDHGRRSQYGGDPGGYGVERHRQLGDAV